MENCKSFQADIPKQTKIINFKRGVASCYGEGSVNNHIACKADFNLILLDELLKYTGKK